MTLPAVILVGGQGTRLKPLTDREMAVFEAHKKIGKRGYTRVNHFQNNLANGKPNNWRCRAGGRYLYVCEEGLVHYCSQQRGYPAIPIEQYTLEDIAREYDTKKACAPLCTIACVQQVAVFEQAVDAAGRDAEDLDQVGDGQPATGVSGHSSSVPRTGTRHRAALMLRTC